MLQMLCHTTYKCTTCVCVSNPPYIYKMCGVLEDKILLVLFEIRDPFLSSDLINDLSLLLFVVVFRFDMGRRILAGQTRPPERTEILLHFLCIKLSTGGNVII